MPQVQHSVTIQRPAEAVFAYLADGENCPQWRPGVLDIKHVSGEGVGATYRQAVSGPMGRRVDADYVITEYEPNRLIEFQTIAGPVRPHGTYELESEGPATRLNFSLQVQLSWLRNLFMGSMVEKTMASEVQMLEKLKSVLESQSPAPPASEAAPASEA